MPSFIKLIAHLVSFSILCVHVCATTYPTRFKGTTWDDKNWIITNTNLDQGHYQSRLSLANGYLGINVAAAGPFFEVDTPVDGDDILGWPIFSRRQTFATISGFWDSQPTTNGSNFPWLNQYGGESVISGVPHWGGLLIVTSKGNVLDASVPAKEISQYSTKLDIASGLHTWCYTWTPKGEASIEIEYQMYVHKLHVNQAAVQLQISTSKSTKLTVVDVLDGDCAVRTKFVNKSFDSKHSQIWSAVQPNGLDVTAYIYSTLTADCEASKAYAYNKKGYIGANESSIAQAMDISLKGHQRATFTKYVGGASSDAFKDPQSVAKAASNAGKVAGFSRGLRSHVKEWATVLPKSSVDDFSSPEDGRLPSDPNIIEQQILAVTNPFHLLSATISENAIAAAGKNKLLNTNSISVCGLGGDCYAGQVFWDADVWMAPGLVASHPQAAQQITNYRVKLHPQAKANIKTAYQSSQNQTGKFTGGAAYSWTSARFGNCTGTGPCFDYEYHLNGDIGILILNYWLATGDDQYWKDSLYPIYEDIAYFYSEVLTYNKTTKKYDLLNATDPVSHDQISSREIPC